MVFAKAGLERLGHRFKGRSDGVRGARTVGSDLVELLPGSWPARDRPGGQGERLGDKKDRDLRKSCSNLVLYRRRTRILAPAGWWLPVAARHSCPDSRGRPLL